MPIPKKKPAHGRAMSKKEPVYDLDYLAKQMHEVVVLLDKLIKIIERMAPQRGGPLPEPSEFVSGGFKRRSGDIYQSVAEPGTPNAGDVKADGDDPSGHL